MWDIQIAELVAHMKNMKKNQSGVLLIEVLFSILIFSFGILGLVGLQAVASQNSVSAEDRNTASTLANDLISQMYIRKTSRLALDADSLMGANPTGLSADIGVWQTRVTNSGLTNATGAVTVNNGITTITITWRAPSKTTNNRYVTQIVI